jgi:hypothetical protein
MPPRTFSSTILPSEFAQTTAGIGVREGLTVGDGVDILVPVGVTILSSSVGMIVGVLVALGKSGAVQEERERPRITAQKIDRCLITFIPLKLALFKHRPL